jgi:hypothetical protein
MIVPVCFGRGKRDGRRAPFLEFKVEACYVAGCAIRTSRTPSWDSGDPNTALFSEALAMSRELRPCPRHDCYPGRHLVAGTAMRSNCDVCAGGEGSFDKSRGRRKCDQGLASWSGLQANPKSRLCAIRGGVTENDGLFGMIAKAWCERVGRT